MATRSLTEVFILMRNNALQNRHLFSEQLQDDDTGPLVGHNVDEELGMLSTRGSGNMPPEWVDGVEEMQFELSRIKERMRELIAIHDKHLNRPTLDDSMDEEHVIEIQTQEITQMFMRCHRLVQQVNSRGDPGNAKEHNLRQNIVSSLARSLQDMSTNFRACQSSYLRKLKSQEERSKQYFGTDMVPVDSQTVDEMEDLYDRGFTQVQMQAVGDNTVFIQERDREVSSIVRSIHDLNDIFKDLATLIVDQGTILDRIDYNIEHTAVHVEKGLQDLQKAEKHQKKNRKMLVVMVLFAIVIVLTVILIFVKS